jgi:hypothetical protein
MHPVDQVVVVPEAPKERPELFTPQASSEVKWGVNQNNVPIMIVEQSPPQIKWGAVRGSISLEDIAFWFGRNNTAWKGANKEIVYQKISSYVKDYRHGVIVKSATFQEMVYSQDGKIYLVKNFSIGEEYRDQKILAYAISFLDPNNELREITMIFFYDENGDIVAFGSGDSKSIITRINFVLGGNVDGAGNGSGTGSTVSSGASTEESEGPTRGNGA